MICFSKGNKIRGCSSAGRAPALQAGGQEFDPPHLHSDIDFTGKVKMNVCNEKSRLYLEN